MGYPKCLEDTREIVEERMDKLVSGRFEYRYDPMTNQSYPVIIDTDESDTFKNNN